MTQQESSSNPQQSQDLLRVCRIGKAQGLKGEVNVQVFTDEPYERFSPGVILIDQHNQRELHIVHARTFKQRWIVQFEGVNDRTKAESLLGTELYIEPDPPEVLEQQNAWYPKDLIGLEVTMAANNQLSLPAGLHVGKVTQVLDGAAQSLLVIQLDHKLHEDSPSTSNTFSTSAQHSPNQQRTTPQNEALVPFLEQFVPQIDTAKGFLTIDPPPGLIESLG